MKKTLVYTILFFVVCFANAQTPLEGILQRIQAAAVSHDYDWLKLAAEEYRAAIMATQNTDAQILGTFKTDSSFAQDWDFSTQTWGEVRAKLYHSYDCNISRVTQDLEFKKENGAFINGYKTDYEYYSDGSLKTVKNYNPLPGSNDWVQYAEYKYLPAPSRKISSYWVYYVVSNGVPQFGAKIEYTYDAQFHEVKQDGFSYDAPSMNWVITDRYTSTYNTQGNRTLYLHESNATGPLAEDWQRLYTYDNMNRLVEELRQVKLLTSWSNSMRTTYEYTSNGGPSSALIENYNSGQWETVRRRTYSYDANGNQTEVFVEKYLNPDWVKDSLVTRTFHANDHLNSEGIAFWVPFVNDWVQHGYYSVDMDGRQLVNMYKSGYDAFNNVFTNGGSRFTTSWVGNLVESSLTEELVAGTLDTWTPKSTRSYTFDANALYLTELFQVWNSSTNAFENITRADYYNSECIAGAASETGSEAKPLCSFANPYQPGQLVHCDLISANAKYKVALYDLTGKLVAQQATYSSDFSLPMSIHAGMYVMLVRDGAQVLYRSKIVVQ